MDFNRSNLNDSSQNRLYLILTVILVILSIAGIILFFQIKKTSSNIRSTIDDLPSITPTSIPTKIPSPIVTKTATTSAKTSITPKPSISPKASPSATLKPSSTPKITATPKLSPSPTIKLSITPTPTVAASSATIINLSKPEDGFSVDYSSIRKLYEDTENSGNRYTFYSSKGNFAIHVGTNDWAWINSDRQFTTNFLISGKPTFRYDINTQTIVDVENNNIKYTIQCVHNGNSTLKAECEEFINSFKLL